MRATQTEIKELKDQIDEIEKKYRDPEAKNKMKSVKKEVLVVLLRLKGKSNATERS